MFWGHNCMLHHVNALVYIFYSLKNRIFRCLLFEFMIFDVRFNKQCFERLKYIVSESCWHCSELYKRSHNKYYNIINSNAQKEHSRGIGWSS